MGKGVLDRHSRGLGFGCISIFLGYQGDRGGGRRIPTEFDGIDSFGGHAGRESLANEFGGESHIWWGIDWIGKGN